MDSLLKTFDPAAEEAASLYVLELLPPDERRGFEHRLDDDPALRQLVRELQGNLDALVLAGPVRSAPLHVWGRIAARVKVPEAPVIGFLTRVPAWVPRLLAAAACLALGGILHAWLAPPAPPPPVVIQSPAPVVTPTLAKTLPPPVSAPPVPAPVPVLRPPVTAIPPPAATANTPAEPEAVHLRERVRVLASQVAALNQVLTQQVILPNGVTRLQVFRLVNSNGPGPRRAPAPLRSLPEALAALAARQHTTPTADPEGRAAEPVAETPEANPATPPANTEAPANTAATSEADPVASADGLTLNDGQPLGFYDPESGRGAIALFNANWVANQNFVVWSQITGADGTSQLRIVGSAAADGQPAVISFNAVAGPAEAPTFFVTLEPSDFTAVSVVPTGPVVAAPPTRQP